MNCPDTKNKKWETEDDTIVPATYEYTSRNIEGLNIDTIIEVKDVDNISEKNEGN